ncbi:MAG: branched-chain amino acid ABC transporter permease [Deltaproteobacteria bacterium]|jgi:branched-chain amino acid transport system permease protein|nr:branched-chain amino acid ABC transporter permease [Deltaproteobacteria bacterium]MBW2481807.1 branched-chain amino acid ABC transporter permease [Deltaproteobacteria bacterium]
MKRRKERIDRGIKARASDIFALTSWREMLYLAAPRLIPIVGLIVLAFALSAYWQRVLLSVSVFALLAISWDILAQTGMISLGQALFFGTGAYLAGIMNHYWGWPPAVTIPLATIVGGLLCTVFLIPVLRLRGIFFSMVTLVLPLMLVRIIEATRIFGGTEGLSGLTALPSRWVEIYVLVFVLLAALFGFRRMMSSDFGLILKGINDNDRSVMNAGINIYWYKIQALFIASSIGAFSGAFLTHVYLFVGMPVFALDYSILPIASAVVGGIGTLAGSTLGAFILVPLSEILRGLGGLRIVIYGLFLVVFTVAIPEGIFHYVQRKYHQFERWVEVE